jgi:hypothetical protein
MHERDRISIGRRCALTPVYPFPAVYYETTKGKATHICLSLESSMTTIQVLILSESNPVVYCHGVLFPRCTKLSSSTTIDSTSRPLIPVLLDLKVCIKVERNHDH